MTQAARVSPQYVWDKLHSASDTLLVCAYDDPEKCRQIKLQGAIDMQQLESKVPTIGKEREIVFYCS
jgi:hypothetical protein